MSFEELVSLRMKNSDLRRQLAEANERADKARDEAASERISFPDGYDSAQGFVDALMAENTQFHHDLATANERIAELEEWCQGLGLHISNLDEQITAARRENARRRKVLQPFAGVYPWVLENLKGEDWARWERAAVECLGPDALKALEGAALACEEKCCMTGVKC